MSIAIFFWGCLMTDLNWKSPQIVLRIGAFFSVAATLPLASEVAHAATAPEKLSVLRAAASEGRIQLQYGKEGETTAIDRLMLAQPDGFDNRAPVDPPPPVKATPPGE